MATRVFIDSETVAYHKMFQIEWLPARTIPENFRPIDDNNNKKKKKKKKRKKKEKKKERRITQIS